jgi:hypothetical protein
MLLGSASKWLYASAYVQSKGYRNLSTAEKKRLNLTSGYLEGSNANCGAVGTTVSACYGPSYKNVSYHRRQTAPSPWLAGSGGARRNTASSCRSCSATSTPCP